MSLVPMSGGTWRTISDDCHTFSYTGAPFADWKPVVGFRKTHPAAEGGAVEAKAPLPPAGEPKEDQEAESTTLEGCPQAVRHNRAYLHSRGMDEGTGWLPFCRTTHGAFNYHSMVAETVRMKAAQDLQKIAKHMEGEAERQAQLKEWSSSRFAKQRAYAEMWDELRETLHPSASSFAAPTGIDLSAEEASGKAPAAVRPSSGTLQTGAETTGGGTLHRASSVPGLGSQREEGRVATAVAPSRGSRGLPADFVRAVPANGVMMYPKDRWLTLTGLRQRELAATHSGGFRSAH